MSFILDALKKSETDRQQQAGGEFSNVPSSSGDQQSFKWLWILGILLLVNVAVLFGILLRPDQAANAPAPAEQVPVEQAPIEQPAAEPVEQAEPSFEERVAEARQNQPVPEPMAGESTPAAEPVVAQSNQRRLMTIDELRLNGTLQLPDLHIDIHVYAEDPAERFVFINMNKQSEGSQLPEGPVVAEITNDGVILEHRGLTFLLPRE